MILQKIKSPGLAHLSWFLASGRSAAVIDPRRDIECYLELAHEHGARITHIFETHRNEDYVSGAPVLAERTGATVYHGPAENPVTYARTTREGDVHDIGQARIEVLETPGHTDDSLSFVLFDREFDDSPVGVFTGDALFVGDVGRTDFYPDRAREVAGLLFDSLRKLLDLGDGVIVYPAHGAGSVCGSGMAEREFSTLGHERRNNPRLAITDRGAFIDAKVAEHHYQPPYFRLMEMLNTRGGSAIDTSIAPPILADDACDGAQLVDVRSVHAFAGAHLPGSLCIPASMLPAFAGWLLDPNADIILVAGNAAEARAARRHLARIGYDRVTGYLPGPMPAATQGKPVVPTAIVDDDVVAKRVETGIDKWMLLDVRGIDEYESAHIEGAEHIYVGELPGSLADLDTGIAYTTLCSSGARATVAASLLQAHGCGNVDVFLGSMQAWQARGRAVVGA